MFFLTFSLFRIFFIFPRKYAMLISHNTQNHMFTHKPFVNNCCCSCCVRMSISNVCLYCFSTLNFFDLRISNKKNPCLFVVFVYCLIMFEFDDDDYEYSLLLFSVVVFIVVGAGVFFKKKNPIFK